MMNIGIVLKKERENLGLSQAEVSKGTKINRAVISLYENNEREISLSNLKVLAIFYGKSISYFFNKNKEEDLTVAYRAKNLSESDQKKMEWAKNFVVNLYEMQKLLEK